MRLTLSLPTELTQSLKTLGYNSLWMFQVFGAWRATVNISSFTGLFTLVYNHTISHLNNCVNWNKASSLGSWIRKRTLICMEQPFSIWEVGYTIVERWKMKVLESWNRGDIMEHAYIFGWHRTPYTCLPSGRHLTPPFHLHWMYPKSLFKKV